MNNSLLGPLNETAWLYKRLLNPGTRDSGADTNNGMEAKGPSQYADIYQELGNNGFPTLSQAYRTGDAGTAPILAHHKGPVRVPREPTQ